MTIVFTDLSSNVSSFRVVDFRKFLAATPELALPYLGGRFVHADTRRLRLRGEVTPGWWRFRFEGREAIAIERCEAANMENWPAVRGHLLGDRLVHEGARAELVHLLPDEEPPRFSPCLGRRSPSGDLLFEALLFETDVEEEVRRAFEDAGSLTERKAVPATLRAAFAYAVLERVSRAIGVPVSPAEARAEVFAIAQRGEPAAQALLSRLQNERAVHGRRPTIVSNRRPTVADSPSESSDEERVANALSDAGARMSGLRRLGSDSIEVRYQFMGERFLSIVSAQSLQVVDAGICLDGEDGLVTLDSLPGVIREAIESNRLVITRRS